MLATSNVPEHLIRGKPRYARTTPPSPRSTTYRRGWSSRDLREPALLLVRVFARLLPTHRTSPLPVGIHVRWPYPALLCRRIVRPGLLNRYRNRSRGLADAIGGERSIDGEHVGSRSCAGNCRRGRGRWRRSASTTAANKRAEHDQGDEESS